MSLQLLKRTATATRLLEEAARDATEAPGCRRRLLCGRCRREITSREETVAVAGSSIHHRANRAGFEFTFGCFRRAPGAVVMGTPTSEDTWFPGYTWVYSLCSDCSTHLGWYFEGEEREAFHGLILDRLSEETPSD